MIVGVPKEIKDNETRVGITPAGAKALIEDGHKVLVETQAGAGSGFPDEEYRNAGAEVVAEPGYVWGKSEMVVKVKEPIEKEYVFFREGLVLFTYLHLAPLPLLTNTLIESKVIGIAYETVCDRHGMLPLLTPMSEVAGRMSVQVGASYLEKESGGRGILLGGVPGVPPAHVTVLGGGIVGTNAARIALGFGAKVTLIDVNQNRLRELDDIFQGRLYTLASNSYNIAQAVREADLVIGGVLIPGATAPKLVTRAMVSQMKKGAVIVDVAIDQGGCVETAQAHVTLQPQLHGRWRGSLLRHQHAGRGTAHFYPGAHQLHVPLRSAARQPGSARGAPAGCRPRRRAQYLDGHADSQGCGGKPAARVDSARQGCRLKPWKEMETRQQLADFRVLHLLP